jgi:hypothetical protein
MTSRQLEQRIEQLKQELADIGPMHPGSLSEQFNVCGTPGCRCKDPINPRRHGPYYQLSFTWRGRSGSRFVRFERLAEIRNKVANYKRFRELVREWIDLEVERERQDRLESMDQNPAKD